MDAALSAVGLPADASDETRRERVSEARRRSTAARGLLAAEVSAESSAVRREAERVSTEQRETVDAAYLLDALCGCVALAALGGIFEPFVRATRRDGAGLGLGLATVKRLVEAHGGKVAVWSTPR